VKLVKIEIDRKSAPNIASVLSLDFCALEFVVAYQLLLALFDR
jgi:hypothetical protein